MRLAGVSARTRRQGTNAPQPSPASFASLVGSVASVVALVTSLSGLAVYFGFIHTQAFYAAMGLDGSVLQFSAQDYLIRSFDGFYVPLLVLCLGGLAIIGASTGVRLLVPRLSMPVLRALMGILLFAGIVLVVNAYRGYVGHAALFDRYMERPIALTVGAAFIGFFVHQSEAIDGLIATRGGARASVRGPARGIAYTLIVAIGLTGVIKATEQYGNTVGFSRGAAYARGLTSRVDTIVHSQGSLGIAAPGVIETRIPGEGDGFDHRYTGLRLVLRSGDKYLLVNEGYSTGSGFAVLVDDSERVRLDFGAIAD